MFTEHFEKNPIYFYRPGSPCTYIGLHACPVEKKYLDVLISDL